MSSYSASSSSNVMSTTDMQRSRSGDRFAGPPPPRKPPPDLGYIKPVDNIFRDPNADGHITAIQPPRNWERRPPGMAKPGEKRLGTAGGFKEFDEEEAALRKRRAADERQQKEGRKAEKAKCKFCHRASCIC